MITVEQHHELERLATAVAAAEREAFGYFFGSNAAAKRREATDRWRAARRAWGAYLDSITDWSMKSPEPVT